jgi:hypothetical protein
MELEPVPILALGGGPLNHEKNQNHDSYLYFKHSNLYSTGERFFNNDKIIKYFAGKIFNKQIPLLILYEEL